MQEELLNDFQKAIPPLYSALEKLMGQVGEIKKTINTLSVLGGQEAPFAELAVEGFGQNLSKLSPDHFYGKSFATAVKTYLKMKGKAATAEEILDALTKGGFEFPEDWEKKFYLRSVASSLSKNTLDFVSINTGDFKAFGLWDFYPEKKRKKEKAQNEKSIKEDIGSLVQDQAVNSGKVLEPTN